MFGNFHRNSGNEQSLFFLFFPLSIPVGRLTFRANDDDLGSRNPDVAAPLTSNPNLFEAYDLHTPRYITLARGSQPPEKARATPMLVRWPRTLSPKLLGRKLFKVVIVNRDEMLAADAFVIRIANIRRRIPGIAKLAEPKRIR